MPKALAETMTDWTAPAIAIHVEGTTPLDWEADGTVAFRKVDATYHSTKGALVVTLELDIRVDGNMYLDLGKLGRLKACDLECIPKGTSTIVIGIYPVINGELQLILKPVLEEVRIAGFDVNLRLGSIIGAIFGTIGAVTGFVFDVILARIISWELPRRLDEEVRNYMRGMAWPLFDHAAWCDVVRQRVRPPAMALFDVKPDSLLASTRNSND